MENNEEISGITYKIQPNKQYRLWRKDYNGRTFYNIEVRQKNYDGTTSKWYRPITFKNGVDLPNGVDIIIKGGIENLRNNKLDPYNPITAIMVTDFETKESQEILEQQAYDEFRDNLAEIENEEVPF
jgi:hypothetical protein